MNLIPSSVMERLYPQGISNLMVGKVRYPMVSAILQFQLNSRSDGYGIH